MVEKLKHTEAFEYYYSLGDKRTIKQVATKVKISQPTATNWNKRFKWQDRVIQRDNANSIKLARKTDNSILQQKQIMLSDCKDIRIMLYQILAEVNSTPGKEIKVKNPGDVQRIVSAYDQVTRLELGIAGESVGDKGGSTVVPIQINVTMPDGIKMEDI